MKKKKLKKKVNKLESALKRVLIERSEMRGKLSVLVYDPESLAGQQIKAEVRMEDELDRQIFLGHGTDDTVSKGLWDNINVQTNEEE